MNNEKNEKISQEAQDNKAGRKRPLWWLRGKLTPLPWVGGRYPREGQWARVDRARTIAVEQDKLCLVCGEPFAYGEWQHRIYGLVNGEPSDTAGWSFFGEAPSPTYGHPSCLLKAVTYCPHLIGQPYPVCDANQVKLDRDQLKELVKAEKTRLAKRKVAA